MEFGVEVSQKIGVRHAVVEPVDFGIFKSLVPDDFTDSRFNFKPRIPGAAVWPIKSAALRMRVSESGIDDGMVWDAEHKFGGPNSRRQIILRPQAIVGRVVEIEDLQKMPLIIRDHG